MSATKKKQVTQGHNIVADGSAEAFNPHPHRRPAHTHSHTKIIKTAASKCVFALFNSITMDQQTDGRTDGQCLRVACPQLTSDARSQYNCRRVGRGSQPPSTPNPPSPTHIHRKLLKRSFSHFFDLITSTEYGQTNGPKYRWTDKASFRVGCL